MPVYPGNQWETATPEEAGIYQEGLDGVRVWLDERVDDRRYRFAVVKAGKLVVDWSQGVDRTRDDRGGGETAFRRCGGLRLLARVYGRSRRRGAEGEPVRFP